jgi:hypothetical protein
MPAVTGQAHIRSRLRELNHHRYGCQTISENGFPVATAASTTGSPSHLAARNAAEGLSGHCRHARRCLRSAQRCVVARLAITNPRGIRRLVTLALGFAAEARRRHLITADVDAAEAILLAGGESARKPIGFIRPRRKDEGQQECG